MAGKSVGLNKKHLRILRLVANLLTYPFLKVIRPILTISVSATILVLMYYAYVRFDVVYNPVIHLLWAIYFCFVISQMISILFFTFSLFSAYAFYLRFRFKQVNQMFKSGKIKIVLKAIRKHKLLCDLVKQLNDLMTTHLTVFYLGLSFSLDIAMYLSLYGQNPIIRIVMVFVSVSILFCGFFLHSLSALFTSEAHKSYDVINSLIVKKHLPLRTKWKVSWTCFN